MNEKSLELIEALESPNWQERYRAVQELAVIGEPEAIEELVYLSEDDEKDTVQEAAEEALRLIPSVGKDEIYSVKNGFYNPLLVSPGFFPEWRVDVINANKAATTWMFTDEAVEYSGTQFPFNFLRAVLQSYQSLGDQSQKLDVIVLIGENVTTSVGTGCGFGLLGLPSEGEGRNISLSLANALTERLANVPGYIEVKPFWLGKEELTPYFHLQNGRVIRYDIDDSYGPTANQQDSPDWFGTNYEFTFAKSVLDTAWVYRSQIEALKQSGHFKHIPQLEE
jgi:hypothetical protein